MSKQEEGRPKDLKRVMQEEQARGTKRRIPDEEKLEERRELTKGYKTLLRSMDWEQFDKAIRALGLQPGTPEYDQIVETWREYQRSRRQHPGKP